MKPGFDRQREWVDYHIRKYYETHAKWPSNTDLAKSYDAIYANGKKVKRGATWWANRRITWKI